MLQRIHKWSSDHAPSILLIAGLAGLASCVLLHELRNIHLLVIVSLVTLLSSVFAALEKGFEKIDEGLELLEEADS